MSKIAKFLCLWLVGCGTFDAGGGDGLASGTVRQALGAGCQEGYPDVLLTYDGSAVSPSRTYGHEDCPYAFGGAGWVSPGRYATASYADTDTTSDCTTMWVQVSAWKSDVDGGSLDWTDFIGDGPVRYGRARQGGGCILPTSTLFLGDDAGYYILGRAGRGNPSSYWQSRKVRIGSSQWGN